MAIHEQRYGTAPSYAASALAASSIGWALAPIFIRYLSASYGPHTQNFLRYAAAAVPLLVISAVWYRRDLLEAFRSWKGMGGIVLLNVVQQHVWTVGTAGSTATTAQLISKLSIVFVIIFSFFMFSEERGVIRSPLYLAGTFLSFIGVGAVISRDPQAVIPLIDFPTAMLLLTAVLWAVYTVWAKHIVLRIHPVPMFTVVSIYTTAAFALLAMATEGASTLSSAGTNVFLIGIISGLIPIALAHPAFHYAQRNLGSAFCSSVALFNPLVTYIIALFIFPDEQLILTQWIGAATLLLGTLMVLYTARKE